jgi:hypothetical protein
LGFESAPRARVSFFVPVNRSVDVLLAGSGKNPYATGMGFWNIDEIIHFVEDYSSSSRI